MGERRRKGEVRGEKMEGGFGDRMRERGGEWKKGGCTFGHDQVDRKQTNKLFRSFWAACACFILFSGFAIFLIYRVYHKPCKICCYYSYVSKGTNQFGNYNLLLKLKGT